MMKNMGHPRLFCLPLIGLGLLVSGYLLARTFALMADHHPDMIDICSKLFGSNCDSVLLSPTSWYLGIPLAGWGLVYYVSLASLVIMAWTLGDAFERQATLAGLVMSVVGLGGSLWLTVLLVGGGSPFCAMCLMIHLTNVLLVPAMKHLTGQSVQTLLASMGAAVSHLFSRDFAGSVEARWKVVAFVTVGLVAIVTHQWVYVESALRKAASGPTESRQEIVAAYLAEPLQEIPIRSTDARLGSDKAAVRVVVFSSFQCPGCQQLAQEFDGWIERHGKYMQIIYKHYPLGKACNSELTVDQHPQGCDAACAAIAAGRQGKFWPFHDAIYGSNDALNEQLIQSSARQADLDLERFEADRRESSTLANVKSDIELGNRLKLEGTPAIYIDGRRVRSLSITAFDVLIHHQLDASAP